MGREGALELYRELKQRKRERESGENNLKFRNTAFIL